MKIILGAVQATPETIEELLAISMEHVLRSRAEPGCISHEVSRSCDDPLRLTFTERWADGEAVATHFAVPASIAFAKAATELSVTKPELAIYDVP